jgi:hypothetical protein
MIFDSPARTIEAQHEAATPEAPGAEKIISQIPVATEKRARQPDQPMPC